MAKDKGFWGKLSEKIGDVVYSRVSIDEELMEELEEVLITSDIGMVTTENIIDRLRDDIKDLGLTKPESITGQLEKIMVELVDKGEKHALTDETPLVILVIGVNGAGKTTSIAKLANRLKTEGRSVILAAADTFRAAAGEQLEIWGDRIGVNVIKHKEGADPSAVIFDALASARAKGTDVVICDTAGRLQNKSNLMQELEKMDRVITREFPEAARETLLVLDATTGKNAISQTKEFGAIAPLTGIILTKLDGTAKGGIAVTICDEFDVPVKFIGCGEKIEDFEVFDPETFIGGIFNE